jgi:hypothetical protein
MGQVLHGGGTTTAAIRQGMQHSAILLNADYAKSRVQHKIALFDGHPSKGHW